LDLEFIPEIDEEERSSAFDSIVGTISDLDKKDYVRDLKIL